MRRGNLNSTYTHDKPRILVYKRKKSTIFYFCGGLYFVEWFEHGKRRVSRAYYSYDKALGLFHALPLI